MICKVKILLLFVIVAGLLCVSCVSQNTIGEPIIILNADNSNLHMARPSTVNTAWIGTYNHEVYFCSTFKGKYKRWLCRLCEDGVQKVAKLNATLSIYGVIDSFLYFEPLDEPLEPRKPDIISCYDFQTNCIRDIYSGDTNLFIPFLIERQSLYVPLDYDNYLKVSEFVHIVGQEVKGITKQIGDTAIKDMTYYTPIETEHGTLSAIKRTMVSTEYGTVVHRQSAFNMLYFIDLNHNIIPLFSVQGIDAYSAITVVKDSVYLSFKRYEKLGSIGMKRFENDMLEGTYRISLVDYSSVKLSDQIYDDLYYFGDNFIFACDNKGKIYRLNMDGSIDKVW